MAIATGTALLLAGLGSGAASVYGASRQSRAAQQAARTQSGAATQAMDRSDEALKQALAFEREQLAEQRRQYDTARADAAPYRAIGSGAITSLGRLTGTMGGASGPSVLQQRAPNTSPGTSGGDLVRMQVPNGGIKLVPRALVPQVEAQGGQVIGA